MEVVALVVLVLFTAAGLGVVAYAPGGPAPPRRGRLRCLTAGSGGRAVA